MDIGSKYNECMGLVKQRFYYAQHLLEKKAPSILEIEVAALQIRKICESIAYGCRLCYFSDNERGKSRWEQEYSADKIINFVVSKNRDCFPRPIHLRINTSLGVHSAEPVDNYQPVYQELNRLYRRCNSYLHEFKPEGLPISTEDPTDEFKMGLAMIKSLVSVHWIWHNRRYVVCVLGDESNSSPTTFVTEQVSSS